MELNFLSCQNQKYLNIWKLHKVPKIFEMQTIQMTENGLKWVKLVSIWQSCLKHIILTLNEKIAAIWCFTPTSLFYNISKYSFHLKKFPLKYLNITKTFRVNYNITVSDFWKLALLTLVKMFSRIFQKYNVNRVLKSCIKCYPH